MPKLSSIDSLRGIAVLLVVLVHTTFIVSTLDFNPILKKSIDLGTIGVQLFYILSAFTLCLSIETRKEVGMKNFFLRRFFRIAPMWYVALILYTFTSIFYFKDYVFTASNTLSHVFFLHAFVPSHINSLIPGGWSVGIEVLFYALFPIFFKILSSPKKSLYAMGASISFIWVTCSGVQFFSPELWRDPTVRNWLFQFLPAQLPFFLAGIFLYQIYKTKKYPWKEMVFLTVGLILLRQLFSLLSGGSLYFSGLYIYVPILLLLLFYVLSHNYWIWNKNKALIWIGKISYSMYLLDLLFVTFFRKIIPIEEYTVWIFALVFIFSVLVLTVLGTITYFIIEKPFITWGRKFTDSLQK